MAQVGVAGPNNVGGGTSTGKRGPITCQTRESESGGAGANCVVTGGVSTDGGGDASTGGARRFGRGSE